MSKAGRRNSADHGLPRSNPFDSDLKSDPKKRVNPERTSSAPITNNTNARSTLLGYNEDEGRYASSSASPFSHSVGAKNQYRNDFRDSGGLQNQTTEELGNYAYYKAEEVTKDVNNCLKIAEDIREDATRTLVSLHQQGEQITRTHVTAADIEIDLSRGEKLLGNLGGIFSKTWKPKKTRAISGPVISHGDMSKRKGSHFDQKERLGLLSNERQQSNSRQQPSSEPSTALEKVQVETEKQDDALSGLSNVLDQLKDMAVDMGSELEWQNKAMDNMHDDVEELNIRVKGANLRGRRLLGK